MRIAVIAVLSLCAVNLGDALVLRLARQPYGIVQIRRYYAIPLKCGKTEFDDAGNEKQTCIHAIFPHRGFAPCW